MMAYTFTEVVERLNAKLATVKTAVPSFPPKPVFFGSDVTSKTMCFPALSSFSTLEESTEVIAEGVASNQAGPFWPAFAPYICSARTKNCKYNHARYIGRRQELNHGYYRGWSFAQDRPGRTFSPPSCLLFCLLSVFNFLCVTAFGGAYIYVCGVCFDCATTCFGPAGKPFGWITSSEGRGAEVNFTHIAFPIELASGRVSVTYLSSYENSGIIELWVGADSLTH